MKRRHHPDSGEILREAARLLPEPNRRAFLKNAAGLGALTLLTGCDVVDGVSAETALRRMSRFNDRVQAWLFDPHRLAPEYAPEQAVRPFPFNGFYPPAQAPVVDPGTYRLELAGKIADRTPWTLPQLYELKQETQVTRLVCVEGWSAIGSWTGVRFSDFLERVGADLRAPFVAFRCADGYHTSIDMPTALHAQTQMTLFMHGEVLPRLYGFPAKLRMPTKLGFKNPKHITSIEVTDIHPGGFWEDQGYNWFSGL